MSERPLQACAVTSVGALLSEKGQRLHSAEANLFQSVTVARRRGAFLH